MAFDILTVLALSADCERMFNELEDLLEARRMKMRPQLISAIQCSKAWLKKPWAKQAVKIEIIRPCRHRPISNFNMGTFKRSRVGWL